MHGFLLVLGLLAATQDAAALIEQLRSNRATEREAASRALRRLGPEARPLLEKVVQDPDLEVAGRAQEILRWIETHAALTPRLLEALPGIEDRADAGGDHVWTEIFLEAARKRPLLRKLRELGREDWTGIASRALRAATPAEQIQICDLVSPWRLRGCAPDVVLLLKSRDAEVGKAALWALESMGAVEAVPAILPLVEHSDVALRRQAVEVLAKLGDRRNIRVLVEILKAYPLDAAILAPRVLIDLEARECVPELLKFVREQGHLSPREAAMEVLAELAGPAEVPQLLKILEEEEIPLASRAAFALGRINPPAEAMALDRLFQNKLPGMGHLLRYAPKGRWWKAYAGPLANLLRSPDARIVCVAIPIVSDLALPDTLPDLLRLASFPDSDVRRAAIAALGRLKGEAVRTEIAKRVQDADFFVQCDAMRILSDLGAKEAGPDIAACLKNPENFVRGHAAMALADLGLGAEAASIRVLLADSNPYVGADALRALSILQGKAIRPDLERILAGKDSVLRTQAALLVAELGMSESRESLVPLLKDALPQVRELAVSVIAAIGADPAQISLAQALLRDPDPQRRVTGCHALGGWGAGNAIPELVPVLQDDSLAVHVAAAKALCRLGSRKGAEALLRESDFVDNISLTELNALRRPEAWGKLSRLRTQVEGEGTPEEILEHAAGATGLGLEGNDRRTHNWGYVTAGNGTVKGRAKNDLLPLLELGLGGDRDWILETDRLRVLGRADALRFWAGWLQEK